MSLSNAGLLLIQSFEGCRLHSYPDRGGVWTIGWGATGGYIGPTTVWTQDRADKTFRVDCWDAEDIVTSAVTVPLTQGQYDALTSFAYNIGAGKVGVRDGLVELRSGGPSTLLRKLNAGDYRGAGDQFVRWNLVHGVVIPGLTARRLRERELFDA